MAVFEINDQLELGRLLDWEIGGLFPLQDLVHEGGSPPEEEEDAHPRRPPASVKSRKEYMTGRRLLAAKAVIRDL